MHVNVPMPYWEVSVRPGTRPGVPPGMTGRAVGSLPSLLGKVFRYALLKMEVEGAVRDVEFGLLTEIIRTSLKESGYQGFLTELRVFTDRNGAISIPARGLTTIGPGKTVEDAIARYLFDKTSKLSARPPEGYSYDDAASVFVWAERNSEGDLEATVLIGPQHTYAKVKSTVLAGFSRRNGSIDILLERARIYNAEAEKVTTALADLRTQAGISALARAREAQSEAVVRAFQNLEAASDAASRAKIVRLFSAGLAALGFAVESLALDEDVITQEINSQKQVVTEKVNQLRSIEINLNTTIRLYHPDMLLPDPELMKMSTFEYYQNLN